MRRTGMVGAALAAIACVAGSASATPPEVRTVMLVVSPENAAVAVDGHPRQIRNGILELRGPLGAVFNVEAVASGSNVVQRVAVTEAGAIPFRLVVPMAAGAIGGAADARDARLPPDECSPAFWRDGEGNKHYKPQCLALESYGDVSAVPARPPGFGALTIVCVPKCDRVELNGRDIGPGHIFSRVVVPGRHMLDVAAPGAARRTVVIDVAADQTREVRLSMDPSRPSPSDLLSAALDGEPSGTIAGERADDPGFLTIASYPWSKVSEGGRALCVTPCVRLPLDSGFHVLVLENEEAGWKRTVPVTIRGGEITTKHLLFR